MSPTRPEDAALLSVVMLTLPWGAIRAAEPQPAFTIREQEGVAWLMRPNGQRFFSLGVCCVDQGASRADYRTENPGYAAWQHHENADVWAEGALKNLTSWGFTTVGGWSDFAVLMKQPESGIVFAPVLHIGARAGAPWWDMWDSKILEKMDQVARDGILPVRDDPRVIGYYTDNEVGWWNAILFRMTLEQAASSGQRQRLITLLRESYHDTWSELLRDFDPAPGIEGWDDLSRHGVLFLRPGGRGIHTERRFLGLMAERYYSLVRDIVRKYDRRALILGDRYQSFYYPEVARACGPYVDAVSTNLNAPWSDGSFPRFYLETLRRLTDKPVLIGEFYMAARENRSGNQNNRGIYPVAATQSKRVEGILTTLTALARTPFVVGADWFQYYDEPTHGRFDGENFNFGLIDIHGRPYGELTAAFARFDAAAIRESPLPVRLDASRGVPAAPHDPVALFEPTRALEVWDRERGFVPPVSEFPLADLYVCWHPEALYLGLMAQDVVEDVFYRDKVVRSSDRAEWSVVVHGSAQPIRARLGAGLEPVVDEPAARITNLSGINGNTRNIACLELPAKLFRRERFKAGDTLELASTFFTHCRGYSTEWKGTFRLHGG